MKKKISLTLLLVISVLVIAKVTTNNSSNLNTESIDLLTTKETLPLLKTVEGDSQYVAGQLETIEMHDTTGNYTLYPAKIIVIEDSQIDTFVTYEFPQKALKQINSQFKDIILYIHDKFKNDGVEIEPKITFDNVDAYSHAISIMVMEDQLPFKDAKEASFYVSYMDVTVTNSQLLRLILSYYQDELTDEQKLSTLQEIALMLPYTDMNISFIKSIPFPI